MAYSSGNVFADLGLPNPEEHLAKARLASAIQDVIEERGLTQSEAAKLMRLDQPKVSKILNGRLTEFSTERLLSCLLQMGLDIEIIVHKDTASPLRVGELTVGYG